MTTTTTNNNTTSTPRLHVLFLHLDLGIGGAEQLVLQLASASQALGHQVTLLTSRCDHDHCFQLVKKPHGALSQNVQVWGRWIPPNLMGVGTAFFSTLRVLYLAAWLCWQQPPSTPYLVVLDVLPTPLWLLQHFTNSSLLFYCHFPDKLLIRNNPLENNSETTTTTIKKSLYRSFLDALEEASMPLADSILVNSKFTQQTVLREFPSLQPHQLQVLYPALDTQALDDDHHPDPPQQDDNGHSSQKITIVSLNRYERKKKIELVLQAFALIVDQFPPHSLRVVIAGGYDPTNVENVEYRAELEHLAFSQLALHPQDVVFRVSISDAERSQLLKLARCVVYTPPNEHFGIVPLEVMYAQTPVLACNSGGPLETILDQTTGFLCEPTPEAFAAALKPLLTNAKLAQEMGRAGRKHVQDTFGTERLQREWDRYTQQAYQRGQERLLRNRKQGSWSFRFLVYLSEAILALVLCWGCTVALRFLGVVEPEESILGSMRRRLQSDEL